MDVVPGREETGFLLQRDGIVLRQGPSSLLVLGVKHLLKTHQPVLI